MRLLITGGSGFIGTHVCRIADRAAIEWMNIDVRPPVSGEFGDRWHQADIRDTSALGSHIAAFAPTHVLHLAARTDTDSAALRDYDSNTLGTMNLVRASRNAERFVFASTQFVLRPGAPHVSDLAFDPHTAYGESKAVGELLVRSAFQDSHFVIVRPTNIWGPWHPRYGNEFLRIMDKGLYVHPDKRVVTRTYGYVETAASQMWKALVLPPQDVCGQVFYLGEEPILLSTWVDAFSEGFSGKRARRAPAGLLRGLAGIGDVLTRVGVKFPLTSSRFRSMTQDYVTPTGRALDVLGRGPIDFPTAVAETIRWYRLNSRAPSSEDSPPGP